MLRLLLNDHRRFQAGFLFPALPSGQRASRLKVESFRTQKLSSLCRIRHLRIRLSFVINPAMENDIKK